MYVEVDPKLRALTWPDMLSHGLMFHQCDIHINLTENLLCLNNYEIKGNKNSWELQNIESIFPHSPPSFAHRTFLCLLLKPPKSDSAALPKAPSPLFTTPA